MRKFNEKMNKILIFHQSLNNLHLKTKDIKKLIKKNEQYLEINYKFSKRNNNLLN